MKALKILTGAAAMMVGASALAQGAGPDMHHHGHGMMPILPGVELTAQQKAQMHDIFAQGGAQMSGDFRQVHAIDQQIADLLLSDGPVDRAKIDGLLHQKEAIESARSEAWVGNAIKVHDLLTPQQRARARTARAQIESLHAQLHALMHVASDHGPAPKPE